MSEFAPSTAPKQEGFITRMRNGWLGKLLLGSALAAAPAGAAVLLAPTPAHADTPNYGDWLSGKDPIETGCVDDARTLSTTIINKSGGSLGVTIGPLTAETPSQNDEVGTIELRYSEECGTYWNLTRTKDPTDITYIGIEKNDGYRQTHLVNGNIPGTPAFNGHTRMIYGRGENDEFRAYIYSQPLWDVTPNNTGTYFTSGPRVPKQ